MAGLVSLAVNRLLGRRAPEALRSLLAKGRPTERRELIDSTRLPAPLGQHQNHGVSICDEMPQSDRAEVALSNNRALSAAT